MSRASQSLAIVLLFRNKIRPFAIFVLPCETSISKVTSAVKIRNWETHSMIILPEFKVTDTPTDLTRFTPKQLVDQYNEFALAVGKEPVKRFADRQAGAKRLYTLMLELQEVQPSALEAAEVAESPKEKPEVSELTEALEILGPVAKKIDLAAQAKPARRKREKVFNYPPSLDTLRNIVEGSLRAQARDLLLKGATFEEVEELVRQFDVSKGKPGDHRISERTYGLIRLLHTYIGYALQEEVVEGVKKIFILSPEDWKAKRTKSA